MLCSVDVPATGDDERLWLVWPASRKANRPGARSLAGRAGTRCAARTGRQAQLVFRT
jgi:hypothetical protein